MRFIDSISYQQGAEKIKLHLVVCDNSDKSSKVSESIIRNRVAHFIEVDFYKFDNVGYLPAVSRAQDSLAAAGKLRTEPTDLLLVCNVDIVFEPKFFEKLTKVAPAKDLGIIGPSIINAESGYNINPKLKLRPSLKKLQINAVFFSTPALLRGMRVIYALRLKLRSFKIKTTTGSRDGASSGPSGALNVYGVHGACMIFTGKYWCATEPFRYPIRLFGEEIYAAELAIRNDFRVQFWSFLKVEDYPGVSTGQLSLRKYCKSNRFALEFLMSKFFRPE